MIKQWWQHPFSVDMSVPGWFAFIGLLIVLGGLWHIILGHVIRGIEK